MFSNNLNNRKKQTLYKLIHDAHIWWLVESPILSKVLQLFDAKQSNLKKTSKKHYQIRLNFKKYDIKIDGIKSFRHVEIHEVKLRGNWVA